MSKPIEGKPIFPLPEDACGYGLSERRYYIGQALQGFCANPDMIEHSIDAIARTAIDQADTIMSLLYPQPTKEPNQ